MVKFAHLSDVHLGGWKQEPMQDLNFQSFQYAIQKCINLKPEFILISGDLFDSAYPSIEVLKKTFAEFKKLKEAGIPCFIVAGSHDYSVSGKTFLDVLEKAGFCQNVAEFEEKEDTIYLHPIIYKNIAIYGYPGKKAGLEVSDLKKIKLHESPGMFNILMLHTTLEQAKGTLPIDAINFNELPKADYYALGHLHIDFNYKNLVYPGPIFPNNFQELRDLKQGSFYVVDTNSTNFLERIDIRLKEIFYLELSITDALSATEEIISKLSRENLKGKIILLKIRGQLEKGKNSDINFQKIQKFLEEKEIYFLLKNTNDLKTKEPEFSVDLQNTDNIEEKTIKVYSENNFSNFNSLIPQLMNSMSLEKQEDEKTDIFTKRIIEEARRVLEF